MVDKPELHVGADVLVPDLAGWRRSLLPVVPREPFSMPSSWSSIDNLHRLALAWHRANCFR